MLERNARYWKDARPGWTESSSARRSPRPRSPRGCGRARSTRAGPAPPGPRSDSPRAAVPLRARRDTRRRTPTSCSSTARAPAAESAAPAARSRDAARARDFVWGALGRFALPATGLLPPGHPRPRPGTPAAPLLAGAGGGDDSIRRACASASPPRVRSPDLPGPVRRAHVGALRELGRARRRGVHRDEDHARVPRRPGTRTPGSTCSSGAGSPTTTTRTISRSPCFTRATVACARTSPHPRPIGSWRKRGARADPGARESLYRKFENLMLESGSPRAALPRRGLSDREPRGPRHPAPQHGSVRQLHRGRQGGRAGRRRPAPKGRAAGGVLHVPIAGVVRSSTHRSRAPSSRPRCCRTSSRP